MIQTRYEFSKSLSTSADVSGGGWGLSFSASAGYKQASSTISTGEYAYILSTASCTYYFSKLIKNEPPPLHHSFVDWIRRLGENVNDDDLYIDFFDAYGTHIPSQVKFGARYTQENKIESKKLETMAEEGVNVAVAASYSGMFSAGGGFSMDQSQRESASNFQKNVEKKTITVGAPPPPSGDAQKWASMVQDSPVPVSYDLVSIEEIFTETYMGGLEVDYEQIRKKIGSDDMKQKYCKKLQADGLVDSCEPLSPGLELKSTRLRGHYRVIMADRSTCIEECMAQIKCVGISLCQNCGENKESKYLKGRCYLYQEGSGNVDNAGEKDSRWVSILFLPKISKSLRFAKTTITGIDRLGAKDETRTYQNCWKKCYDDEQCVAFNFRNSDSRVVNKHCRLYAERRITGLEKETSYAKGTTYFISRLSPSSDNHHYHNNNNNKTTK